jgi:hypothetical protein
MTVFPMVRDKDSWIKAVPTAPTVMCDAASIPELFNHCDKRLREIRSSYTTALRLKDWCDVEDFGVHSISLGTFPVFDIALTGNFEVMVNNVGTVYTGPDWFDADDAFSTYVKQSATGYGRAANEMVVMVYYPEADEMEMLREHHPDNDITKYSHTYWANNRPT